MKCRLVFVACFLLCLTLQAAGLGHGSYPPKVNIVQHHYDTLRTGWNQQEAILDTTNVAGVNFGVIATRTDLDGTVLSQPLIATGLSIAGGTHDILYVATENDTVYALDATTGATLASVSLGTAVPTATFFNCENNSSVIGVTSTMALDPLTGTLYVLAASVESSNPVYRIHALDWVSLADKVSPPLVAGTQTLTDGSSYAFNPAVSRQRSALLFANGSVYATFASFCDENGGSLRGWLMGWNARSLVPIIQTELANRVNPDPVGGGIFLTSIWMSGAGPAADQFGNIYFVTGNSDSNNTTTSFDPPFNIQESVAKVAPADFGLTDYFTPGNLVTLDEGDEDFGSGGVLLLPDQAGAHPHLATAAGKDGNLYLIDRDNMGHYVAGGPNAVLGTYSIGGCFCAESYFVGSDGVPRVVTSGGRAVNTWDVQTSPSTALALDKTFATTTSGQASGFFTTVSSYGTQPGTAIIWAVSKPVFSGSTETTPPQLYAFDAMSGATLFSGTAGDWRIPHGNMNTTPVEANGKVDVVTDGQLYIFGLH